MSSAASIAMTFHQADQNNQLRHNKSLSGSFVAMDAELDPRMFKGKPVSIRGSDGFLMEFCNAPRRALAMDVRTLNGVRVSIRRLAIDAQAARQAQLKKENAEAADAQAARQASRMPWLDFRSGRYASAAETM